ncbi:MAG: hypothetical protein J7576_24195 [Siphonobacter aquaeclarae]|nr:hypothetical protein [Siphonobacter aquaeclarae]
MKTRFRFIGIALMALCGLSAAAALSMDPVKEKLGLVSFSPVQTASGKIVYKQYEDNTQVPYTMYGLVAGDLLLGRVEPDEREEGNRRYTCIVKLADRTVELRDETLWSRVDTGDSARISFQVRTQKLTGERSPVIVSVVRLK